MHMIPFCTDVLQGKQPEDNDLAITKPVALILLAHLLGDVHQPLHVGAMYFDSDGKPTDPEKTPNFTPDVCGNILTLTLLNPGTHGPHSARSGLHMYWDDNDVESALDIVRGDLKSQRSGSSLVTDVDIIRSYAAKEPANAKVPANPDVKELAIAWADEILPISKDAHDRLEFSPVVKHMNAHTMKIEASGQVTEKSGAAIGYRDFAGQTVNDEMHKAGWRLANLLEQILL